MDSQIAHHQHDAPDHDRHGLALHQGVGGEEDGQHHEKTSVLKKVKAKAKKIKNNITKHGHGGHDHDQEHDDYEEDDDDDDQVMEDTQIQGAPLYEGAAMRSGQRQHQDVGVGMSTTMHNQAPTSRPSAVDTGFTSVYVIPTTKENVHYSAVAPSTTMSWSPSSLEKDPHAPRDKTDLLIHRSSEVKVADPAKRGNKEAGESQIFDTFAKMKVNDEHKPSRSGLSSGTSQGGTGESQMLDSFAKMKVSDEHEPNRTGSSPGTNQGGGTGESQMLDSFAKMKVNDEPNRTGSSYTQKISAVGSAMGGKAVAAKDYMASKLGYGETTTDDNKNTNKPSSSPSAYGKKMAFTEKLKPGEEDRALSQVISEALAFKRRKDEAFEQPQPKVGKVTESEELTRRLGKDDSRATEKSSAARTADAAGRSVVEMVKETVGSWLGKTGDQSAAPSQQSLGTTTATQGVEARPRQQERGGTAADSAN